MKRLVLLTVIFFTQTFAESNIRVVTVEKKSDINKDIEEFINLLPAEDISSVLRNYIHNDTEVRKNWEYLHEDRVQKMISDTAISKEFKKIEELITKANVNTTAFMIQFYRLISLNPPHTVPLKGAGLRGLLLGSIKPLIPMSSIKRLATQKYIFSSQFRHLVKIVTSKDFKTYMIALVQSKNVRDLENDAIVRGKVNMKAVYEFIASFEFLYEYLIDL